MKTSCSKLLYDPEHETNPSWGTCSFCDAQSLNSSRKSFSSTTCVTLRLWSSGKGNAGSYDPLLCVGSCRPPRAAGGGTKAKTGDSDGGEYVTFSTCELQLHVSCGWKQTLHDENINYVLKGVPAGGPTEFSLRISESLNDLKHANNT